METPTVIRDLVERYEANREAYESGTYKEAQLRREFIDPFFRALGWDVENASGWAEAYKDVIHEDALTVGGATKAPDYSFRIGGTRKFFVEAKKPSVNIKRDVSPAFQLRRYAWSAKLSISILTDFGEFAVYDCRVKPSVSDPAGRARITYLTYHDYLTRWDEIADVFSRDAVLKGSFDRFIAAKKTKRGTAEVDDAFLAEIDQWRLLLARNIALRNERVTERELNFAVQQTIDRIVFLRICEDRGIEQYGTLMALQNGTNVYARLGQLFRRADERFNSGLFHFSREKGRNEEPDRLTLSLVIDDKPLKEIFRRLYYPESPYEFSVITADILGHVYERFLGKIVRLTAGHRAEVEDKPEVRKAGGVYYTPTFVVEYIVRQVCQTLLQNKSVKQVAKLKILDPACGSGSFLIAAYQSLLDWHRDEYLRTGGSAQRMYQAGNGEWRLTTQERKRILLNNIYGVDIDAQAVEVTKLSLLLKVLEGESDQTLANQMRLFHERALPDLANNIRSGNSLISTDFFRRGQISLLSDDNRFRVNAFDWSTEFPQIFRGANGGFDALIGNPPWGASFAQGELLYLREQYSDVIERMVDSYIYFIARATQIARPGAAIGFVIPSTILNQADAQPVRRLLLNRGLTHIVNLGRDVFGRDVLNTSTIFVSAAQSPTGTMDVFDVSVLPLTERPRALEHSPHTSWLPWRETVSEDPHLTFFVGPLKNANLLRRMRREHDPLITYLHRGIERGVTPDCVEAHVLRPETVKENRIERGILKRSISGEKITTFGSVVSDQYIIYLVYTDKVDAYPHTKSYLLPYREKITCKEVATRKHPWWALHRGRDPEIFESPKIIGLTTAKTIELVYDETDSLYVTDAMYVFRPADNVDAWSLMCIMQSRLFLALYRIANQGETRVIPQVKAAKLERIPIPKISGRKAGDHLREIGKSIHELRVQEKASRLVSEKAMILRHIERLRRDMDEVVRDLYGVTDEEWGIVNDLTTLRETIDGDNEK